MVKKQWNMSLKSGQINNQEVEGKAQRQQQISYEKLNRFSSKQT